MNEQERADFETWALARYSKLWDCQTILKRTDDDDYFWPDIAHDSEVWQAARAAGAERDRQEIAKLQGIIEDGDKESVEREAELMRVKAALAEAAAEIPCAGPVANRIRVLKREHAEREAAWQAMVRELLEDDGCHGVDWSRAQVGTEPCGECSFCRAFIMLRSGPQPIPEGEVQK